MSSEKKNLGAGREMMHRAMDGELSAGEQEAFLSQVSADPELRKEWEALTRTVRSLEKSERLSAPPFFTAQVMRRLPAQKRTVYSFVTDFLFRTRSLKWNMATALAVLFISVLAFGTLRGTGPGTAGIAGKGSAMVTLRLYAPDARRVAIAGTFNKWKTDSDLLTRGAGGYWNISLPLQPGEYTYMFIVDGTAWVADPEAESYRDDGFGSRNAVVRVRT